MASAIKIPYHQRLFLQQLIFSWLFVFCFIGYQYQREKEYKLNFYNTQMQLYNRHLLEIIDAGLSYEEYIASHALPFDDLRISIITLSGAVIYDNTLPITELDNHRQRPEVANALENGSGQLVSRHSESDGQRYIYTANKGERVIVRSALPYTADLHDMLKPDWTFLWVLVALSTAMSVLAYITTHRLGKNMRRLKNFAEKAQNGESFDESEPFPNDDLGTISNHIVQLYTQWQHTVADRDRAHEAAMRKEQEKIHIKKELTNNINHELKTPVASMQVCLETLLSGIQLSEEKRQDLIARCYANNDRLRRLLNDVSLITRMEDGSQLIGRENVVLNDILEDIANELAMMPDKERMAMYVHFPERVEMNGNMALVTSIFRNLTENALNYSGGKNIYVTLIENDATQCRIRLEDDGCGVEESQLPRLFERFYRVDKGRSRQTGGTGLGLAIVKHAVQFHGGTISVSNRPEGGLRFDFTLHK